MSGSSNSAAKKTPTSGAGSKADSAYEQLRHLIVECDLAPGVWVTVAALSERLGVGRAPTYEALMRLEMDGFGHPVKRRGWQVAPLTLQQAAYILDVARFTAVEVIALVVRNASDADLRRQRQLGESWFGTRVVRDTEAADGVRLCVDHRPFEHMLQVCGNPIVATMARGVLGHYERVMNFALMHGSFVGTRTRDAREALLTAIENRDAAEAQRALGALMDVAEHEIMRLLTQTESLRETPLVTGPPEVHIGE